MKEASIIGLDLAKRSFQAHEFAHMRAYPQWRWHLDEVFVKVNGKLCYLWRAVDHEARCWRLWSPRSETRPGR